MKVRVTAPVLATALAFVLAAAPARAQNYTFTPFDFNLPTNYTLDSVGHINDNGLVAVTAVATTSGGKTTKLGFVQAVPGGPFGFYQTPGWYITSLRGINNSGYLSGFYEFSTFSGIGPPPFPGPYPLIVFNGQGTTLGMGVTAMGINNNNTVTGPVTQTAPYSIYLANYPSGGHYTVSSPAGPQYPVTAMAINDNSTVVGTYNDASNNTIPYIRDAPTNTWFSLSPYLSGLALSPSGINNASVIAGGFTQNGTTGAFVLNYPTGKSLVIYPGANILSLQATGINNHGVAVGIWSDLNGTNHGFLLTPQPGGKLAAKAAPTAVAGGKSYTLKPASSNGSRTTYVLPQIDLNEGR